MLEVVVGFGGCRDPRHDLPSPCSSPALLSPLAMFGQAGLLCSSWGAAGQGWGVLQAWR